MTRPAPLACRGPLPKAPGGGGVIPLRTRFDYFSVSLAAARGDVGTAGEEGFNRRATCERACPHTRRFERRCCAALDTPYPDRAAAVRLTPCTVHPPARSTKPYPRAASRGNRELAAQRWPRPGSARDSHATATAIRAGPPSPGPAVSTACLHLPPGPPQAPHAARPLS
eukprot:237259-Chlamydomonas_euryale.AAC.5